MFFAQLETISSRGCAHNKVVERLRIEGTARNAFVAVALMAGRICAWSN
jgi:hypothetical protein